MRTLILTAHLEKRAKGRNKPPRCGPIGNKPMMSIELLGLCILCLDNQEMHANSRSSRTQNGMKQQGSAEF